MRRVFVSHFQSSDNRIIFLNTQRRIFYSNCGFYKPLFFSCLLRPKNYTAFFRNYMACILKQVPCILKYMPYVFYEIRKQKFPHHKASFILSLLVQIVIHPLHFPTKIHENLSRAKQRASYGQFFFSNLRKTFIFRNFAT